MHQLGVTGMTDWTNKQQYLHAMDIPVWLLREEPEPSSAAGPVSSAVACAEVLPAQAGDVQVVSQWQALGAEVAACTACELHRSRTQTVFGVGATNATLMVVGEAPGADEDRQGEPFVGRAGQLLNEMLFAIGLRREQVYIANILKCRPPNNRDPAAEEVAQCEHFLHRQISHVRPAVVLAVGRVAAQNLLHTQQPLSRLRGQSHSLPGAADIPVVVTYHPAYLLRSPRDKHKAWQDLCVAKSYCDPTADSRGDEQ